HRKPYDASSKVRLRSSLSSILDAVIAAPFDHDVHYPGHCAGAAHGSLKPPPTRRLRRAILHLSYSMTLTRLLGTVTSRLSTGRSPLPSLDITTASTGLLCWRDLHPQEWQLASLHPLNTDSTPALRSSGGGRHPLGWTKLAELLAVVNRGARLGIAADQLVFAVCVIVVLVAVVALAVSSSSTGHPRPSAPFWPVVFPALGRLTRFDRL